MTLPSSGQISISDINTEIGQSPTYSNNLNFLNNLVRADQRVTPPTMGGFYGKSYFQNTTEGNCNNGNCNCSGNCGNTNCNQCYPSQCVNCANCDTQAWLQNGGNCACTYNCNANTTSYNCNCACDCSKIVCAKLHEFGMMSSTIWSADQMYGQMLRKKDKKVYRGYIRWARIVTAWMDGKGPDFMFWIKDKNIRAQAQKIAMTDMAQKIGTPWSEHMAYLMGVLKTDNTMGRILMNIGRPICRIVDLIPRSRKKNRKHGLLTVGTIWACLYFSYYVALGLTKTIEFFNRDKLLQESTK
jgi:hypothetical protein